MTPFLAFIGRLLVITVFLLLPLQGCAAPRGVGRLGYSIQVGAFAEVDNAERQAAALQRQGIDAFYFRSERNLFVVRFGDYTSWEKARDEAERLKREGTIASYYITDPERARFRRHPQGGRQDKQDEGDREMGVLAARTAERFIGIPYRWGGNNVAEGMDCSGFVRAVYNLCGTTIPRTSREQFKTGHPVARSELRQGDLVFFGASTSQISHVGIFVGNGHFVHAPKRGDVIKTSSLGDSYYTKRFQGGRRYF
jgi:hypothetical protein